MINQKNKLYAISLMLMANLSGFGRNNNRFFVLKEFCSNLNFVCFNPVLLSNKNKFYFEPDFFWFFLFNI